MKTRFAAILGSAIGLSLFAPSSVHGQDKAAELLVKVAELERRLAEVESTGASERKLERLLENNRLAAGGRAAGDREHYKPDVFAEFEKLYQVAYRNWRTDEARDSLK